MVEPVGGNCNLRCEYCYQESVRTAIKVMPEKVLERITPDKVAFSGKIKFLWHGGEPMLAGIDFFKKAVELQKIFNKNKIEVVNAIQTNATLINDDWAEFFAENNFKIGTSIDGPKWIHNKIRSRSYDRVIKGVQKVQKSGKEIGVIITISKNNVKYPEIIWNEIIKPKQISRSFEINICSSTEITNLTPSHDQSLNFLIKIFDLWVKKDDPEIYIKTFRVVLRYLLGGEAGDCAFEYNKCNRFVAIDERGDAYICNRFLKRPIAHLGNVLEQALKDIVKSERAMRLYEQIAKIKEDCKRCEWLMCCGGGCAFQRWVYTGRFDAGFPECELRKKFFTYVKNKIK
jgi:uncharacterized protein